ADDQKAVSLEVAPLAVGEPGKVHRGRTVRLSRHPLATLGQFRTMVCSWKRRPASLDSVRSACRKSPVVVRCAMVGGKKISAAAAGAAEAVMAEPSTSSSNQCCAAGQQAFDVSESVLAAEFDNMVEALQDAQ